MKLQSIKKEIIKAVPSILELKFGCEILIKQGRREGVKMVIDYSKSDNCIWFDDGNVNTKMNVSQIKKILGRPITLSDCVKAIIANKKWKAMELKEQAKVFFNLCMYWDMNNEDNLEKKDELVINYLYKILKS